MALSESKEPLSTTQVSQIIALSTGGQVYKISATLKDSLEHRLKREGYVVSVNPPTKSLYSITAEVFLVSDKVTYRNNYNWMHLNHM